MKICSACNQELPLSNFLFERRRNRHMARCKSCRTNDQRRWRKEKLGYETERYSRDKEHSRERHLVRKYGVDLKQYAAMLERQSGLCAICGAPEETQFKRVFHVDHCHTTGVVRGLLCRGCNHMLGVVGDDPAVLQRAIEYLCVPQVAAEVIGAYMDSTPTKSIGTHPRDGGQSHG